jgi:hypothetical protein
MRQRDERFAAQVRHKIKPDPLLCLLVAGVILRE